MFLRFHLLVSCLAILPTQFAQASEGDVGNGGDPLRAQFEAARGYAAERVNLAKPCAFSTSVREEVRNWIMTNKDVLRSDILESPHKWITDHQATCAFTQTNTKAEISLSFETCRPGIKDVVDAMRILVHESVHHFDISDERFADEVADAVLSLGSNSECPTPPSQDPFDPASCPGSHISAQELRAMIPLPNSPSRELGFFRVYMRKRTCYGPDWCGPWKFEDSEKRNKITLTYSNPDPYYKHLYYDIPLQAGQITAQMRNNSPEVLATSSAGYGHTDGRNGNHSNFKYYWTVITALDDLSLRAESVTATTFIESEPAVILAGENLTQNPNKLAGWMTRSCLRQTFDSSFQTVDHLQNQITEEYEAVLLSHFSDATNE